MKPCFHTSRLSWPVSSRHLGFVDRLLCVCLVCLPSTGCQIHGYREWRPKWNSVRRKILRWVPRMSQGGPLLMILLFRPVRKSFRHNCSSYVRDNEKKKKTLSARAYEYRTHCNQSPRRTRKSPQRCTESVGNNRLRSPRNGQFVFRGARCAGARDGKIMNKKESSAPVIHCALGAHVRRFVSCARSDVYDARVNAC